MLKHHLEILVDAATRQCSQQLSEATGRSQGGITRETIAKIQLESNDKTPVA